MLPQSGHSQASSAPEAPAPVGSWPHLHFRVSVHMLQLEPRVPSARVPLQAFLLMATFPGRPKQRSPVTRGRPAARGCPASSISTLSVSRPRPKLRMKPLGDGQCGKVTEATFCLGSAIVHPDTPRHCHGGPTAWAGMAPPPMSPRLCSGHPGDLTDRGQLCQGAARARSGVWDGVRGQGTQGAATATAPPAPTSMLWHVVGGVY